jgi:hypothetical protein
MLTLYWDFSKKREQRRLKALDLIIKLTWVKIGTRNICFLWVSERGEAEMYAFWCLYGKIRVPKCLCWRMLYELLSVKS